MSGLEMMLNSMFKNLGVEPAQIANMANEIQEMLKQFPDIQADLKNIKENQRKILRLLEDKQNE